MDVGEVSEAQRALTLRGRRRQRRPGAQPPEGGCGGAQCRRDTGQVQPLRAGEQAIPSVALRVSERESRAGAIVEHFTRSMDGAVDQEVQPHPTGAAPDMPGIDAVAAQFAGSGSAQWTSGDGTDHRGIVTEQGERHRHVGLGTTEVNFKSRRLQQQLATRCPEAQQQLPEADNTSGHGEALRLQVSTQQRSQAHAGEQASPPAPSHAGGAATHVHARALGSAARSHGLPIPATLCYDFDHRCHHTIVELPPVSSNAHSSAQSGPARTGGF